MALVGNATRLRSEEKKKLASSPPDVQLPKEARWAWCSTAREGWCGGGGGGVEEGGVGLVLDCTRGGQRECGWSGGGCGA